MSRIVEMRTKIEETMRARLPDRVSVISHRGRLDIDQIKRYAVKAPAVVLACMSAPGIEVQGSPVVARFRWIAVVIARNERTEDRGDAALGLVELLLYLLANQRWDLDYAQRTDGVNAANLYSTEVDAAGLAIWAVTWDQGYDLPQTYAGALAAFLRVYATWDLDTTDGIDDDAQDQISLPQ